MANYDLTYEGQEVQDILDAGNTLKADGYIFCGVATPSTNPGTPTEKVYYICGAGTYNNFGTSYLVREGSIGVFKYNGSWNRETIVISDKEALVVSADVNASYNDDGSIYLAFLYINRAGYSQRVVNIQDTIEPLSSPFSYVLSENNTVTAKITADITDSDIILLRIDSNMNVYGGFLYADYCNKKFKRVIRNICTSPQTTYNEDGTVYLHDIFVNYMNVDGTTTIQVRDNVVYSGTGSYAMVLNAIDNTVSMIKTSELNGNQIVLLRYDGQKKPFGGYLYDDYTKKLNRPLNGKTMVINGDSNMSGYTVAAGDKKFWEIMQSDIGVNVVNNYAIAGSTVAQNGDRTPLIDRIQSMDTDADIVLIGCGTNDWAHMTPLGADSDRVATTFYGAMHLICQYLCETYKGKIILWVSSFAAWRYQTVSGGQDFDATVWNATNQDNLTMQQYKNAQIEVLRQYGIQFFDIGGVLGFSQQDRWWCGDSPTGGVYIHANGAAQPLIADVLSRKLLSYIV